MDFDFSDYSDFKDFLDTNIPNIDFDFNLDFHTDTNKNSPSNNDNPKNINENSSQSFMKNMFKNLGFNIDIDFYMNTFKDIKRSQKVYESITTNYKSWILILLSLFLISKQSKGHFSISFITFLTAIIAAHYIHNDVHVKIEKGQNRPNLNVLHLYHHEHDNILSHAIQIILEFVSGVYFIVLKHIFNIFSIPLFNFIDNWTVIFTYIFYTVVHNINYGYFKVNEVHRNHHVHMNKNMGPDICDILFNTKYEDNVEQHDHYIPSILFSYFFVGVIRFIWNKLNEYKIKILCVFYSIYISLCIFLCLCIFYIIFEKNRKEDNDIYERLRNLEKIVKNKKYEKNNLVT